VRFAVEILCLKFCEMFEEVISTVVDEAVMTHRVGTGSLGYWSSGQHFGWVGSGRVTDMFDLVFG